MAIFVDILRPPFLLPCTCSYATTTRVYYRYDAELTAPEAHIVCSPVNQHSEQQHDITHSEADYESLQPTNIGVDGCISASVRRGASNSTMPSISRSVILRSQ